MQSNMFARRGDLVVKVYTCKIYDFTNRTNTAILIAFRNDVVQQ